MHTQLRGQCHRTTEPKQCIERIERQWYDTADCEGANKGRWDEVEEGEHGEDGAEHAVVDDGWVAFCGVRYDIAHKRHNEEGPEELH
jgi:hypothetical protein